MLSTLHLPIYPSCKSCLAWSADGELAVAAGENVYIQIPRKRRLRRVQDPRAGPFTSICLKVNCFTIEEWPWDEPLNFREFSLGEEQSLSTIVALAWSPPGLAKHKRSVLAVLTSNLRLSLWTSTSDPEDLKTWKRIIVVNHALKKYFKPFLDLDIKPSDSTKTALQRMTRIRSFAWTLPFHKAAGDVFEHPEGKWGVFFIAITNDNNQIVIVRIRDGYTVTPSIEYRAEVQCYFNVDRQDLSLIKNGISVMSPTYEASGMILSESHMDKDCIFNELNKTIESHSRVQRDSTPNNNLELDPSQRVFDSSLPLDMLEDYSLLKAALSHRHYAEHLYFSNWVLNNGLYACVVGCIHNSNPIHKVLTLRFEGLTEDTNIAVLDDMAPIDPTSLTRYQQTLFAQTPSSPTYKKMLQCKADFDDEHNLGGLAIMKTWGLTWLGNIELACITCHPGDMVEYTIPSKEKCTLIFHNHCNDEEQNGISDPFASLMKKNSIFPENIATAQADITKTILSYKHKAPLTVLGAKIIYAGICASFTLRNSEVPTTKPLGNNPPSVIDTAPIQSAEALNSTHDPEPSNKILTNLFSNFHKILSPFPILETCSICNQVVPFHAHLTGFCPNNHQFSRCALTFLAITEPGISKYCTGCNRAFLNEELLLGPKHEDVVIEDEAVRSALYELADICLGEIDTPKTERAVKPTIDIQAQTAGNATEAMDIDLPLPNVTSPLSTQQPTPLSRTTSGPYDTAPKSINPPLRSTTVPLLTDDPTTTDPTPSQAPLSSTILTTTSLAHHLFTKYSTCPYCRAKYVD